MGKTSLVVLLSAPVIASLLAIASIYLPIQQFPNSSIQSSYSSCFDPTRKSIFTDISRGHLPAIDNHLCFVAGPKGILRELLSNRVGVGALALFTSILIPLLQRLSYLAVSPNTRTTVIKPGRVVLLTALAAGLGWGPSVSVLGVSAWAIGGWEWSKSNTPRLPPIPVPATSVYLCNFFIILFSIAYCLPALADAYSPVGFFVSSEDSKILIGSISHFFVPPILAISQLVVGPHLTGETRGVPKDREEISARIKEFDADGVSYSFERIWGYYRKAAGISAIFWWYGISRVYRGYAYESSSLTDSSILAFLCLSSLAFSTYLIIAIERSTFRSLPLPSEIASTNPSEAEELSTNLLLSRALERAPAGFPWAEVGWKGVVLSSLVGGPGFALAMHAARGEEEDGWRCRREWRELEGSGKGKKGIEGKKSV